MTTQIDVGSVLGGRYKVTANVLVSHEQDLVLDGIDQVLNRPVSILVAGPGNGDQVAQSAREVATGERPGSMQILDLGVSDGTTYLITNHSSAPDLLDLVVATNPPYVEPFFTDTLGSEIFGQPRSSEPETYDGLYDDLKDQGAYIQYPQTPAAEPSTAEQSPATAQPSAEPSGTQASNSRNSSAGVVGSAAAVAGAAAYGATAPKTPPTPPTVHKDSETPAQPPTGTRADNPTVSATKSAPESTLPAASSPSEGASSESATTNIAAVPRAAAGAASAAAAQPKTQAQPASDPKVSLWSDEDYDFVNEAHHTEFQQGEPEQAEEAEDQPQREHSAGRLAGLFPAAARQNSLAEDDYSEEYDDEPEKENRSMRWLVGGVLAAVLIAALIFAVTNLGNIFGGTPSATDTTTSQTTSTAPSTATQSATPTAPATVPPAIETVTREGDFQFAATYDGDLVATYDGNAASYWSDMEFANDAWGGYASDVPLVVKLKANSDIKSVTLEQLGGSGGAVSIYTNDKPTMDGAKQQATNSFTGPSLNMTLSQPTKAQYVIVDITALPKLAAPKTRFGYGLRLAEIKVQ
ncbi:ABC transporter substrate-binding protein [Pseudarthrobacter sp. J1763]|uniref:ABC transporter substrate-binding protein n=1 Tax=Pseudarthrobacter sp. J1763 TaxID=3420445 RepID=UPI003D26EB92